MAEHNVELCDVTLVFASTPSPIDASLVPSVICYSVGSSLSTDVTFPPEYDSSYMCDIQANIGALCHDRQEMRHLFFC